MKWPQDSILELEHAEHPLKLAEWINDMEGRTGDRPDTYGAPTVYKIHWSLQWDWKRWKMPFLYGTLSFISAPPCLALHLLQPSLTLNSHVCMSCMHALSDSVFALARSPHNLSPLSLFRCSNQLSPPLWYPACTISLNSFSVHTIYL